MVEDLLGVGVDEGFGPDLSFLLLLLLLQQHAQTALLLLLVVLLSFHKLPLQLRERLATLGTLQSIFKFLTQTSVVLHLFLLALEVACCLSLIHLRFIVGGLFV